MQATYHAPSCPLFFVLCLPGLPQQLRCCLFIPCREVLYETGADGKTRVTGLKVGPNRRMVTADAYVAALDVPGIKTFLPPAWRASHPQFDAIYKLKGVPVITVQLRYNGWVTEMKVGPHMGTCACSLCM